MNYCPKCGTQLNDGDEYCSHCGNKLGEIESRAEARTRRNVVAIVGFIMAFAVPIVGLVLSIIGLKRSKELNGDCKQFALAGIIGSIVMMVINAIITYIIIAY